MIKEVTRFTLVCDGCSKELGTAWRTGLKAEIIAESQMCSWLKFKDKHYCPDCWTHDENNKLLFKTPQK